MSARRCAACGRSFTPSERLTRAQVQAEYGIVPVDIDRMFERIPVTSLPGGRRVYVTRADVESYLAEHTYRPGERLRKIA